MKRNETLKHTLIIVIRINKADFLIIMVSVQCMAHDMPIPMVIIALHPKHIQVGEVREMFLLNKVLSAK